MKWEELKIIFDPTPPYGHGDGLTDDTQYIQDCIDEGIQPAPGTYRITKLIEVGTTKLKLMKEVE